jgi:crotonobetainyl-CoA:carnitine CoA-transferase CaiB-like acyl-CoA transferase
VSRAQHSAEIVDTLTEHFRTSSREHWLDLFAAHDLFVGQVNRVAELMQDEQVRANHYLLTNESGIQAPAPPFTLRGVATNRRGAPALGAHSDEVLAMPADERTR